MFQNRKLIIATKHQKEKVIGPILKKELGINYFIDEQFDTDQLGTFSGEIERKLDPISTVREKCLRAMKTNNCDLGVASEGSFGSHPSLHFINADDEFLIFIDTKNNIEIVARELSTETNFNGREIESETELMRFAKDIGFNQHAIILRKSKYEKNEIHKGITCIEDLKRSFEALFSKHNSVYAETDMRAMYNPTRMLVIQKAAEKLVQMIKTTCPHCKTPGFSITEAKKGLICSLCGLPTSSPLSYIYTCQKCKFTKEAFYPNSKNTEDPMYCDYCNP